MRACYLPDAILEAGQNIILKDEQFHHLIQVCRIKLNDEVLILNGRGARGNAMVKSIAKREAILGIKSTDLVPGPRALDALVAIPKKDALELIVKMSIELGLRRLILLRSSYSQEKVPEVGRLQALIQSAVEQSNNPWTTEILVLKGWDEVPWSNYQHLICFDPSAPSSDEIFFKNTDSILTLIGPEGGFSEEEIKNLQSKSLCHMIALPTPILRAPTAFAVSAGWVTARMR